MFNRMALASVVAGVAVLTDALVLPVAPAAAQVTITFGAPPPAPVYEVVPVPRSGYVWAPGHYVLVNDRYVWQQGRWLAARPGYRYVPDTWERVAMGGREQWRYVPSRWDRDGDGIPDRHEHHAARGGPWGDRDHDGIPNAYDRYDNRR
ncbi:MAG: YXWGXW repeat-containing protein [Reyranellaceae bacterium]